MSNREAYIQYLKSKGVRKPGIAVDEEGYFSPEKMQEGIKKKREQVAQKKKINQDESDVMSEATLQLMEPSSENRKRYSDTVMKRLKRMSPRT